MPGFEAVIEDLWWLGVPAGFLIGFLLGMNPLAWPILGAAVALGGTGEVGSRGAGVRTSAAFGAGIVVVYTAVGFAAGRVDEVTEEILQPYAGIGYVVLGMVLLAIAGFLLVRREAFCAACERPAKRNPTLLAAFLAGLPGGFVNCPACAGIILGAAASAAKIGNPLYSGAVMGALGVGHAFVLTGIVWLITNGRTPSPRTVRVLQAVAAVVLILGAAYFFRQASLVGVQPGPRLP